MGVGVPEQANITCYDGTLPYRPVCGHERRRVDRLPVVRDGDESAAEGMELGQGSKSERRRQNGGRRTVGEGRRGYKGRGG